MAGPFSILTETVPLELNPEGAPTAWCCRVHLLSREQETGTEGWEAKGHIKARMPSRCEHVSYRLQSLLKYFLLITGAGNVSEHLA